MGVTERPLILWFLAAHGELVDKKVLAKAIHEIERSRPLSYEWLNFGEGSVWSYDLQGDILFLKDSGLIEEFDKRFIRIKEHVATKIKAREKELEKYYGLSANEVKNLLGGKG